MSWFEFLLFVHILAAVVWVGGAVAIQGFGILTAGAGDPAKSAFFAQNVSKLVMRVFFPAALIVLLAGIGLVEEAGWEWDEEFVMWGLILWIVVATIAFGFLGRAMGAAGRQLEAEGPSPELGGRMRKLLYTSRALLLVLVVIIFLMTVKPGL